MKISPFDWEEERMLNALLASWRSALYQQSNRKWSVRPKLLSLFLPRFSTRISFPLKSRFLSFVGSDFLQPGIPTTGWGGALMRNPKIKCCKLGFSPRSQPAPYLDPVWEEFYVQTPNSEISPSVSCHPATPHWYTIPQPPLKVKIYAFDPFMWFLRQFQKFCNFHF